MKTIIIALATLGLTAPALAQASAVERNEAIYSADGTKIGKVDRVLTASDGTVTGVRIIYRGKFIIIPATTLNVGEKGIATSLSNAELKKL